MYILVLSLKLNTVFIYLFEFLSFNRVAGHPLAQNEKCLHMFLIEPVIDKNYVPGKIRTTWGYQKNTILMLWIFLYILFCFIELDFCIIMDILKMHYLSIWFFLQISVFKEWERKEEIVQKNLFIMNFFYFYIHISTQGPAWSKNEWLPIIIALCKHDVHSFTSRLLFTIFFCNLFE